MNELRLIIKNIGGLFVYEYTDPYYGSGSSDTKAALEQKDGDV